VSESRYASRASRAGIEAPSSPLWRAILKSVHSGGYLVQIFRSSSPASAGYDRALADALSDTRQALEASAERNSAPAVVDEFRALNRAYRRFAELRDASGRIGAPESVFSPAHMTSAARAADRSAGKGAFARGEVPMQRTAETGKRVVGRTLPDSGTPERAMIAHALGGTGAGAGLYAFPMETALAMSALGALYSRPGNRAFQWLASANPRTRAAVRRAIERAGAFGAPAAHELWD